MPPPLQYVVTFSKMIPKNRSSLFLTSRIWKKTTAYIRDPVVLSLPSMLGFTGANVFEVDSMTSELLQLGAGTSLPRLIAVKLGANVTLTDDANRMEVLENIRRVCDLNNLNCNLIGLTWRVLDTSIFNLRSTIIIGADVLYENNGRTVGSISDPIASLEKECAEI